MTDRRAWEEQNSRYLSMALQWVRCRLRNNVAVPGIEKHSVPRDNAGEAKKDVSEEAWAERLRHAEAEMEYPPALSVLCRVLGLSGFERNVILLCAAVEFDPGISALLTQAVSNYGLSHPTFALTLSMFDDPAWDALSPERPLRFWRLIEINQPGAQALTASPMRADERIVGFIKGVNYLDDRLAPYLFALESAKEQINLVPSQDILVDEIVHSWETAEQRHVRQFVQLLGANSAGKLAVATAAAARVGRRLHRMSSEALPSQPTELETFLRLWQRESLLLPIGLYLDAQEMESDAQAHVLRRFIARCDGLLILAVRESISLAQRESCRVEVSKPSPEEQRMLWETVAPGKKNKKLTAELADHFDFDAAEIRRIGERVISESEPAESPAPQLFWVACRVAARPNLDTLCQRLDPKATWNDIVLPQEEMLLLRQIAAQVRQRNKVYREWGFARRMNRGLGISALFTGESGTGKTMAAEVIANDLGLDLYRIDLSAVISKYIGETEKNLRRVFDAAESGGSILFFDEADALFGKRSEVKDSHDRYANIEVNYLLQRMEAYRGLAILATNMRSALDHAFLRRLRFIVSFPFPSVADRRCMWQKAFPPEAPLQDLDYDRLARIPLSGGSVHNAAICAAFLAADASKRIGMREVLRAVRSELIKIDRPVNEADFRVLEISEVPA